jgi:hypothetical protein
MRAPLVPVVLALVTTTAGGVAASTAVAAPPKTARITLGVGMAGARVNQLTSEVRADGTLGPAPFSSWGKLIGEFCFEGTACSWDVPGGGGVQLDRTVRSRRVVSLGTTARGWKTSKGVGPGTTVTTLRARYRPTTKMTTCDIGGFGASRTGYRYGRHSFFETSAGKVRAVFVTRGPIRAGAC